MAEYVATIKIVELGYGDIIVVSTLDDMKLSPRFPTLDEAEAWAINNGSPSTLVQCYEIIDDIASIVKEYVCGVMLYSRGKKVGECTT